MIYINIAKSVLINQVETDHSIIETRRLKNVVIFIQTTLSFVLSRKVVFCILIEQQKTKFFVTYFYMQTKYM